MQAPLPPGNRGSRMKPDKPRRPGRRKNRGTGKKTGGCDTAEKENKEIRR